MPKGPKGEKRPADVIGGAVLVGKIPTGEIAPYIRIQESHEPGIEANFWAPHSVN